MLSVKLFLITILYCVTNLVVTGKIVVPCKIEDEACVTKSANIAWTGIIAGIPELGIETSDPLHLDKVDGNLSVLKYIFTDSTVTGFKNCDITNFKLDLEKSSLHVDMTCSDINMHGTYEISGRLIVLPVEGNGDFKIVAKKYQIGVDSEVRKVEGKDGKTYLNIKNFKLTLEAQDGMIYDFKNLFNGRKDLAEAVLQFANENWKEVADFVQTPVLEADFKKITSNVNKYLKTVPLNELFLK